VYPDAGVIQDSLRTQQIYTAILIWIQFILSALSLFISLVDGYCVGGGAAGVTWSSLPNAVWQIPNLFVLVFALQSLYLDMNMDYGSTLSQILVAMWFILLACLVNIVYLVALAFELGNNDSTFWLQNGGAWVITVFAGTILFIVWFLWIARRLYVYRLRLGNAHYGAGWTPITRSSAPPDEEWGMSTLPPPPVPPPDQVQRALLGAKFSATLGGRSSKKE